MLGDRKGYLTKYTTSSTTPTACGASATYNYL